MTKTEIENHAAWKYISSLSNSQRHNVLFVTMQTQIEACFNVSVEEWPFTRLNEISADHAYISVTDPIRSISFIAVLKPKH